jgi:hypothetical protein
VSRSWSSFLRLTWPDRLLVVESTILLASVWAGLKIVHFPVIRKLTYAYSGFLRSGSPGTREVPPQRIAWAVVRVADHLPMHTTCLVRALAGYAMVRRRGFLPELRIGILPRRLDDSAPLRSHAWIEHDGRVLIGHIDDLRDYALLAPPEKS